MSNYYIGPFGRMLPVTDDPSPVQGSRSSREPMSSLYQLPPPRAPAPLRFGTDPFLHQHTPIERPDSGIGRRWDDMGPRKEQLPSVSQLLTPISLSSTSSSPYDRRPGRNIQAAYSVYHHDPSLASSAPSAPIFERSAYQQPRSLPPITDTPIRNRENELRSHPGTYGTLPELPLHHDRLPHRNATPQNKEPGNDDLHPSTTITENRPQAPPVQTHVVDERYIEGEGLCYVYADGSYCPKNIDGVPVNANWGITKAGKPRKRLAQACLTCREKKIKCQPNLPKCDQCQKSGRVCRFENAPRGNRAAASKASQLRHDTLSHESPGASSSLGTAHTLEQSTSLPVTTVYTPESDTTMGTLSVWDHAQRSDGDSERPHSVKKRRLSRGPAGKDDFSKRPLGSSLESQRQSDYAEVLSAMRDLDRDDPLACEWSTDPYEADPESTTHYIKNYFTYVNDDLYPIFPRKRFLLWVKSCQTKSPDDKMLLYWMLAMGCVFSDRSDKVVALKKYSRTARYAVEHTQNTLTLQLAQSRIIMSLWYYAIGAVLKAWDYVGAAIRTVSGLNYNFESLGVIVDQTQGCEYGLHPQALIECRRRTFWTAYLMDRFSSFNSLFIPSQAAFLRLPCGEETYEAQQYATVPYFRNKAPSSADDVSVLSPLAFLIDILSLWGDVSDQGFRLSMVPAEAYNEILEEFYASIVERCDEWARTLPDDLTITADNIEKSIHTKKANIFLLNHLVYHNTLLKLNRYVRYEDLRAVTVDRFICRARYHAAEILRICLTFLQCVSEHGPSGPGTESEWSRTMALNPFVGYIVLSAVDVLSAAGPITGLIDSINLIRGGLEMVGGLGRHWQGIFSLALLIETRLNAMVETLHSRPRLEHKLGFVMDSISLEAVARSPTLIRQCNSKSQLLNKQDLLYWNLPRERLLIALGVDDASLSKDNILWIPENTYQ